jgi:hypothetical protein
MVFRCEDYPWSSYSSYITPSHNPHVDPFKTYSFFLEPVHISYQSYVENKLEKRGGVSMTSKVTSIGLKGLEGYKVSVEVRTMQGSESFVIVGLPDASVKESKERVTAGRFVTGLIFF